MENETSNDNENLLAIITNIIQAYIKHLTELAHLAKLEAILAVRSFVILTILFIITLLLLFSTWAAILTALFIFLSLYISPLFSALIITFLNFILLGFTVLSILKTKDNLFFPATRRQLSHSTEVNKDSGHEHPIETN